MIETFLTCALYAAGCSLFRMSPFFSLFDRCKDWPIALLKLYMYHKVNTIPVQIAGI